MSVFGAALLMLVFQALPVQGVVFKKGTREPLSEATVELRLDLEGGAVLKDFTTEDDGRFQFDNVAPGRYRVTVSRRGYTRPPLIINVRAGQPAEIQLPMNQAGVISGRITDANGQPLGNIEVLAMKASYPDGRRVLIPVASAITNDLGEYRLFWLSPGRYYVSAVHPTAQGMFRRMTSMAGLAISAIGTSFVSTVRSVATPDPAIGGVGPESETERYAPIFFGGATDEEAASPIEIRAGAEVTGVNIAIAPVRLRRVRGLVIDGLTGRPAEYASVTVASDTDEPRGKEFPVDRETGTFDLVLLPGVHTVNANSASGEGSITFQLPDADINSLVIPTTPVFDISGRIVLDGDQNSSDALGVLRFTLRHDPPRKETSSVGFAYSSPLPDGSFVVSGSAGEYRMNIAPLLNLTPPRNVPALPAALQNAYVKSIRFGNADVLNGVLRLEGKPSARIEVVIGKNAGAIDGQVVTDPQRSSADVSVVLVPDVRRRTELYRTTTADVSGRFHFDRVPPGDYKVFSWEEVQDGVWFDAEYLRVNESRGTAVRVEEGRTENIRVVVIP
jgi:protocatechuate 3,4-dioxygenase beta subunit